MRPALLLTLLTSAAQADPALLRLATVIPEGTAWARELLALSRDAEGAIRIKWAFGGIAGDEQTMEQRIARDQLDGTVSGGMLCEKLSPSMRVVRIPGLFQSRAEVAHVLSRLKPQIDKEMLAAGFANLAEASAGASIPLTRMPAHDLAELRKQRIWIWDLDEPLKQLLPAMGIPVVPLPLYESARAYDSGRHDGFLTPPQAALAFQWSTQARWYTDFQFGWIVGCLVVANRAFDRLPVATRDALRTAAAKVQKRMEDVGAHMDEQLLGGLFEKQGLKHLRTTDSARAELFEAARVARDKNPVVAPELLGKVMSWLADFRAQR